MLLYFRKFRPFFFFTLMAVLVCSEDKLLAEGRSLSVMPLPLDIPLDGDLVALGEKLFYDKRLSRDLSLSCASCHDLLSGGIDRLDLLGPRKDRFNSPTLFNVGFHFRFFWNGRASSLEEQIELTITSPTVFNNDWNNIIERLEPDSSYQALVAKVQPSSKLHPDLLKKSLAEFERSLWTPNSRFDKFLRGDESAINEQEKKGFQIFRKLGCSSCHQGMLLGGNMFQKFGIFSSKPHGKLEFPSRELGRFVVTNRDEDKYVFKVPSLRNIELTAPYFHDGGAKTLEDAVAIMSRAQLGRSLSQEEISLIIKFLKTLTGEWRGQALK